MRKTSWLLVALLLCLVTTTVSARGKMALTVGDPAPPMRGTLADNDLYIVDYSAAKVTVVNFWATWCAPCREEMPSLHDIQQRRGDDGLQVVGVHVGRVDDAEFVQFHDSVPVAYPLIRTTDRWLSQWGGLSVLPRTYLVDSDGRILRGYVGATPAQVEALVNEIDAALDGKPLGPVVVPQEPDVSTPVDREQAKKAAEAGGCS